MAADDSGGPATPLAVPATRRGTTTTTQKRLINITDFGRTAGGTLTIKNLKTGKTYVDGLATRHA